MSNIVDQYPHGISMPTAEEVFRAEEERRIDSRSIEEIEQQARERIRRGIAQRSGVVLSDEIH